jgi:MoaA/NifB/PqqE/SkfB family radical SAM enzyme
MDLQLLPYPERLHIELTSRCNFKCLICKHGYENYGEDLSGNICNIIVNEMAPYLSEIELQGTGESLLSANFEKVFDAASINKSCRLNLITNASLLQDTLIDRLVRSNMQLTISLDGYHKDEFRMHRPVGDFDLIIHNIRKIYEKRKKIDNKSFSCVINMVVTQYNRNSVHKAVDMAYLLGIDFLFVSEVRPCMPGEMWDKFRLDTIADRHIFNTYINDCMRYAAGKKIGFHFNPFMENKKIKKKVCVSPWKHTYIYANGDVSLCCELHKIYGNLQYQDFASIWNGACLNNFRNLMLLEEYDSHCLKCCLPWGLPYE